ncbi:hypothetical protein [Petrotoga olearia]|uniref:hypothetical protein n=1 Tax=Petrotoga olearia TaxID=156203 RepID=UPI0011B85157|nr:hypothetical protein [Petrotoga olearia]
MKTKISFLKVFVRTILQRNDIISLTLFERRQGKNGGIRYGESSAGSFTVTAVYINNKKQIFFKDINPI